VCICVPVSACLQLKVTRRSRGLVTRRSRERERESVCVCVCMLVCVCVAKDFQAAQAAALMVEIGVMEWLRLVGSLKL